MLTITNDQLRAFGLLSKKNFIAKNRTYLSKAFPKKFADISEEKAHQLSLEAMTLSTKLNFFKEISIQKMLFFMIQYKFSEETKIESKQAFLISSNSPEDIRISFLEEVLRKNLGYE